jgi:C4-type Zn-finger protein
VRKTPATVELMAKAAAAAPRVDVALVEAHLSRYVVSCPLCKGVGQLGVAHEQCKISSGTDAKDGIAVVVVMCKRCGYLMTLAADQIEGLEVKAA